MRVIEAMRSLQRHENVLPISSLNEIVDYIGKNYNNDGDLYAQVRTAMKQLVKEGSVGLNYVTLERSLTRITIL